MRTIVNYLKSLFCQHDYELLKEVSTYESPMSVLPIRTRRTYRCRKCGFVQRVKL